MNRVVGIALFLLVVISAAAAAADLEIQGSMFLPVAYVSDLGRIMDKNHVVLGRMDSGGTVYDLSNHNLGFIEKDLTVRDVHYKTLAHIDADGVMTDETGAVIGAISDAKLTDAAGRPVLRYEWRDDKRGILAYFFFFSPGFGN